MTNASNFIIDFIILFTNNHLWIWVIFIAEIFNLKNIFHILCFFFVQSLIYFFNKPCYLVQYPIIDIIKNCCPSYII